MNPADSTVLVTGAAKRVGAEFARAFAAAGAHVFIHCNTSRKEAEALADELGGEAAGHIQHRQHSENKRLQQSAEHIEIDAQHGGQTDAQNHRERLFVDVRFFRFVADGVMAVNQAEQHEYAAEDFAGNRRDGDARDAQLEPRDQQNIENDVDDAADSQKIERSARVADSPQNRRAEVVNHAGRQTDGVYFQIQSRAFDNIFRTAHQFKQTAGESQNRRTERETGNQCQRDGGMHRTVDGHVVLCAAGARDRDGRADA